jgi:hypothetical protein
MPITTFVNVFILVMMMYVELDPFHRNKAGNRLGSINIRRERQSVISVFNQLGRRGVREAYRMYPESFWKLHKLIRPYMKHRKPSSPSSKKRKRGAPNGLIDSSVRLAVTLRYLAGGSKYDLAPLFGISYSSFDESIRYLVDAINECPAFKIEFPADHTKQREIALQFKHKSRANFNICCGAINGLLIWISQPSIWDCAQFGFQNGRFYCGRKNKFGLNMQAVCDARHRFLDVDISHPGATSDHIVFSTSLLFSRLQKKLLAPGLCIFGDNAYVNTEFMATPYMKTNGYIDKHQDDYNFYHSQLRIRIEMSFGMLVRRFGILRKQANPGVPIKDTIAQVMACCRIHNFLIDKKEDKVSVSSTTGKLVSDIPNNSVGVELELASSGVDLEPTEFVEQVPVALLDAGDHFDDMGNRHSKKNTLGRTLVSQSDPSLPRQKLSQYIQHNGFVRPSHNVSRNKDRLQSRQSIALV